MHSARQEAIIIVPGQLPFEGRFFGADAGFSRYAGTERFEVGCGPCRCADRGMELFDRAKEREAFSDVFDIHYHLLYGVDDGPKAFEDSVALAEASIEDGVTHIACTPHSNDRYKFDPAVNQERRDRLQAHFGDRLTLGSGCDFHLSYENIENLHKDPARYTINAKQYLLVEFPDFAISQNMAHTFFQMISAGVIPIITHPERNPTLMQEPGRMVEWLRLGCLVQVTAASLDGRFGNRSQAIARELIQKNWVHIIASDAHSVDRRGPSMTKAYRLLESEYGKETAERLCKINTKAVYLGEPLPAQPEGVGLYEELNAPKKGFFSRLFGR